MKRIFIAVNLPENVKGVLSSYQERWPDLPANWTKKENLHITLQFLGNVSEKELEKVAENLALTAVEHSPFEGMFQNIVYGPTKKRPSMVWAHAEKTPSLLLLQRDVKKAVSMMFDFERQRKTSSALTKSSSAYLEKWPFTPHLTLARLRQFEFQRLEPEEWPLIEEDISLPFSVQSFEIMESMLDTREPEYEVLQSFLLSKAK